MFHVVSLSRNYRVAASPPPPSSFILFRCLLSAVVQLIKRFRLLLCILFALYLSLPSTLSPSSLSCIFIAVVASIRFVCHIENSFHSQFAVLSSLCFTLFSLCLVSILFLVAQLTQINTLSSGLPAAPRRGALQPA